jgi:hypothetical protein
MTQEGWRQLEQEIPALPALIDAKDAELPQPVETGTVKVNVVDNPQINHLPEQVREFIRANSPPLVLQWIKQEFYETNEMFAQKLQAARASEAALLDRLVEIDNSNRIFELAMQKNLISHEDRVEYESKKSEEFDSEKAELLSQLIHQQKRISNIEQAEKFHNTQWAELNAT